MPPLSIFSYTFFVPQSAIDEYGHVNNVIYVQRMQDAAVRHATSLMEYKQPKDTGWFAREHRVEYLVPAYLNDEIEVSTWISSMKRSRVTRKYEFLRKSDGRLIAKGETQWTFVDLRSGRPIPIPAELMALFPIHSD